MEPLNKIPANVQPRLLRAIEQLLNAGRNTAEVAAALSPQVSFGKYDGCTPLAIRELADSICRKMSAEIRAENRKVAAAAMAEVREQFPDMAKYFKR